MCVGSTAELTFALCLAAGVQVRAGEAGRAGLALHLALLVLEGADPAALTLAVLQREVRAQGTLD